MFASGSRTREGRLEGKAGRNRVPLRRLAAGGLAAAIAFSAAPSRAAGPAAAQEEGGSTGGRVLRLLPELADGMAPPGALLRRIPALDAALGEAPPFLADTDLRLRFRSFLFDRQNKDGTHNDAWALGGWLQYSSGWAFDFFQLGGSAYTSQAAWGPETRDGTSLLEPSQKNIAVLGQAYARLRYEELAVLTGYRQAVDDGYVNSQDNRMIPNTFEGITLKGKLSEQIAYHGGYLWRIKPRNSDDFVSMSEQAGVEHGDDEGLWLGSLTLTPAPAWQLFAADYYVPDTFNTAFGRVTWTPKLCDDLEGRFGLQFTDQRSTGDEQLGDFDTWNFGVGAGLKWSWGLSLGAALHVTGEGANVRSPYGTWPGWLSMIETDFDRAGEKGWGVAATWDFGAGSGPIDVPGFTLRLAYAQGTNREDPATGAGLPTVREIDLDAIYNVPVLPGLQVRLRNAYIDTDGSVIGYQFRLIVNYEFELL